MRDHQPLVIREFKGEFDRGTDDTVPAGYLLRARNAIFTNFGVKTRPGFTKSLTIDNLLRIQTYKRIGEADRLLILDTTGKLFDSTNLATPILNIPAMIDFSMVNMFNRAYISPHNGVRGLPGEFLYVYGGSGTARKAGGSPPSGFTFNGNVFNSASTGHVEKGQRFIAVAFETDTGFVTRLGPVNGIVPDFATYGATGTRKMTVQNLPIGPAGTVARRIAVTKVIADYAVGMDQLLNEFFFLPSNIGGRVADNTTTGPIDFDFYDSDLVDSADYLLDSLDNPPAFVHVNDYNGSLVGVGEDLKESVARISKAGEPESFNGIVGFVIVNPSENQGLKCSVPLRGDLHLYKSQRHFMTRNNGSDPVFWPVIPIDSAIGSEPYGIAQVLDSKGQTLDRLISISRRGLEDFNGAYNEFPLSFVFKDVWDRINISCIQKSQISTDPINKRIYVLVPLDGSTTVNALITVDYQNGLSYNNIRYSLWSFGSIVPRSAIVDTNFSDQTPVFRLAGTSNVYNLSLSALNDDGVAIPDPEVEIPLTSLDDDGSINHITGVRLRVVGSGALRVIYSSLDRALTMAGKDIVMSTAPGRELTSLVNFQAEKCSVSFKTSSINEWFHINKITLFVSKLWMSRVS